MQKNGSLESSLIISEKASMVQVKKIDPKMLAKANQDLISKSKALGRASGKSPTKKIHGGALVADPVTEKPAARPNKQRGGRTGGVS